MDWLEEELEDFDDDYLIIDCPGKCHRFPRAIDKNHRQESNGRFVFKFMATGQIELYTHIPVMKEIVSTLQKLNYRVCAVYLLDSQFIEDASKFFSGVMTALSAMVQLEVPHINVLTKMDLLGDSAQSRRVERFVL